MRDAQINIRISSELKEKFKAKVKAEGLDYSTLIVQWIENYLMRSEIEGSMAQIALNKVVALRDEHEAKLNNVEERLDFIEQALNHLALKSEGENGFESQHRRSRS